MTAQFVDWPVSGHRWQDSGEGGMYAMLVVLKDVDLDDPQCHVDVRIEMTVPDAPVGNCWKLWEPWDPEEARKPWDAQEALQEAGKPELASWALKATSPWERSDDVLAAIHLGSTHETLYLPGQGPFRVSYNNLTGAGQGLYDILRVAFGRSPKLLTFIET